MRRVYRVWVERDTSVDTLLRATELCELADFSCWDSLIAASAEAVGAEILYSEDLQHGQTIAGLRMINPFAVS
ncbi:MAG TPA: hypothetical protein VNN09_00970 [Candidatus Competibacteraceae bacterium]|nr:hypothetical protein [Candidatus Competibacteraceae bacterium]